jgi:regulator of protease activity HflC (stomatin/prohibitin superfamily)
MRKWTDAEETAIMKAAAEYPDHLLTAFNKVANETGRTPQAIAVRYYNVLLKRSKPITKAKKAKP